MLDRCHFKGISSATLRDVPLARAADEVSDYGHKKSTA